MHGLCAEGIGNSTRLAKCPRDFVEAPSQMLENWCWQKTILERLSKHYQTGEQLPVTMLNDMIQAKHVNVAFGSLRQIYLSRLDLEIHSSQLLPSAGNLFLNRHTSRSVYREEGDLSNTDLEVLGWMPQKVRHGRMLCVESTCFGASY